MSLFTSTILCSLFLISSLSTKAADSSPRSCRLIIEAESGQQIVREGPCEIRRTPASTFKIPLALMGFDTGVLQDETHPLWNYRESYQAMRVEERQATDPTSWLKHSVIWYSQKLTQTVGMTTFQKYVNQFHYGNGNLIGNPGKKDGLTQAWLGSSLEISPDEQVSFLQKLLNRNLGVSEKAYQKTAAILPRFVSSTGWTFIGKTGSVSQKRADGTLDKSRQIGWFVGWAEKDNRRVIFAQLLVDETPQKEYGGPRARESLMQALPELIH
ncbi:MAG: class D beta-lactamase [Verrucomicrobiota bacterium]